jgi:ubiquinone/menaquinone biosynthesis C-methylase UbiE
MAQLTRAVTHGMSNVSVLRSDGTGLNCLRNCTFDSVLAVDSFPYLIDTHLAHAHLHEVARVLRPRGHVLIMNYSYREDLAGDCAEVALLAQSNGFDVLRNGTADLSLWDGRAFLLRKK